MSRSDNKTKHNGVLWKSNLNFECLFVHNYDQRLSEKVSGTCKCGIKKTRSSGNETEVKVLFIFAHLMVFVDISMIIIIIMIIIMIIIFIIKNKNEYPWLAAFDLTGVNGTNPGGCAATLVRFNNNSEKGKM